MPSDDNQHINPPTSTAVTHIAVPTAVTHIAVQESNFIDVTEWVLPCNICQSSGRPQGSNACTVIAVTSALHFLNGTLTIPKQFSDLNQTLPYYNQLISKGNQVYDLLNMPPNQPNLDVKEVLSIRNQGFEILQMSVDTAFFSVQDLENFLNDYVQEHQRFAAILIVPPDKSMLLCFDGTTICMFESHSHNSQGGIIAFSVTGRVSNFIHYLQIMVMQDWQTQLQGSNLAILQLK